MAANPALWADTRRDLEVARKDVADLATRAATLEERGAAMDPDVRLDREIAIGTMLHNAYGAIKAALERLVLAVDGSFPEGRNYHVQLIRRAAASVPGVRPATVPAPLATDLNRLRQFRHAFRHAYGKYDHGRAVENVGVAVRAVQAVEAELAAFASAVGLVGTPAGGAAPSSDGT